MLVSGQASMALRASQASLLATVTLISSKRVVGRAKAAGCCAIKAIAWPRSELRVTEKARTERILIVDSSVLSIKSTIEEG